MLSKGEAMKTLLLCLLACFAGCGGAKAQNVGTMSHEEAKGVQTKLYEAEICRKYPTLCANAEPPFDVAPINTPSNVACFDPKSPNHYVPCLAPTCEDKKRVLMDSEDGKHHCYAFYLLGGGRP